MITELHRRLTRIQNDMFKIKSSKTRIKTNLKKFYKVLEKQEIKKRKSMSISQLFELDHKGEI